jgi:hypothetical protein
MVADRHRPCVAPIRRSASVHRRPGIGNGQPRRNNRVSGGRLTAFAVAYALFLLVNSSHFDCVTTLLPSMAARANVMPGVDQVQLSHSVTLEA